MKDILAKFIRRLNILSIKKENQCIYVYKKADLKIDVKSKTFHIKNSEKVKGTKARPGDISKGHHRTKDPYSV